MYLTDYREQTLMDVITQLEPGLFKKVTGLDVADFQLLVSLNVFNGDLMNDAIYKFKRYEDSSLSYTGVNKHAGEKIGLFNTVISYDELFVEQQATMSAPPVDDTDVPENPFEFLVPDEEDEEEELPKPKKPEKKKKNSRNGEVVVIQAAKTEAPKPATPASPEKKNFFASLMSKKSKFDPATVKVGTVVSHKAFGKGTVAHLDGKYINVQFDDVLKPFVFPQAFLQGFLKVEE